MNVLLTPMGSHGDVHPFLAIGRELAHRGHRVTVLTSEHFRSMTEAAGLRFVSTATEEEFTQPLSDPNVWHPRKGIKLLFKVMIQYLEVTFRKLADLHEPGNTTIVHSPLGLAARLMQEKHNVPTATIHLAPFGIRSIIDPPVIPGAPMPRWTPHWYRRFVYWLGDKMIVDPLVAPRLNAFRRELNLPPIAHPFKDWCNSPNLMLGLFPQWFAFPAPDWPSQLELTGFPLYDEAETTETPPGLDEFLSEDDPPIIFTPGSAMFHGQRFFASALEACQRLHRFGIFLTRYEEHLPSQLPDSVRHYHYVPFSVVLPRAAAVVHHGGIGTTAQALRAGIPQLIMPMAYDQPDNAARLIEMGVGDKVGPRQFTPSNVAEKLTSLLQSPVISRCEEVARKFMGADPIAETCDLIEERCSPSSQMTPTTTTRIT